MKKIALLLLILSSQSFASDPFKNNKDQCITVIKSCSLDQNSSCKFTYCGENIYNYKLNLAIEKNMLIGKKIESMLDFEPVFKKILGPDFNSFVIEVLPVNSFTTMDYSNRRIRVFIDDNHKIKTVKIG